MAKVTVSRGDCISSIGFEHGFFWETLWNHSDNAELKQKRKDPNILMPGDEVVVPDKREKQESGGTEQKHRFRRKGVPEKLHIIAKIEGKPMADEPYILTIDGEISRGTTDGEGAVKHPIPPGAQSGQLVVGEGPTAKRYDLKLGGLDPVSETSGVQGRLRNLGYDCGEKTGEITSATVAAIKAFQQKAGLNVTGEIDQALQDALVKEHGS